MSEQKYLGKIHSIRMGFCGYQDMMFGLHVEFRFDNGSGITTSEGAWSPSQIEHSASCKWTEEDREKQLLDMVRFVDNLLTQAKKSDVSKLIGVPVELTIENQSLKSWRILTEVL